VQSPRALRTQGLPYSSPPAGTHRYVPTVREGEGALTRAIVTLATQYGRYGYRQIAGLLRNAGWRVGKDRRNTNPGDGSG